MLDFLIDIDNSIFLFFNGLHTPFLDRFMMLFTGRFIWIPLYASILFALFKAFRPRVALAYLVGIGLAILLTDQTCATIIRPLVERLRPSNLMNPLSEYTHVVDGYRGGLYGFPSCHAANSFALAVFMSMLLPRKNYVWLIMGWALLNSYSRLYLGVHYPGDLLVGALIGSSFGYICYRLAAQFDSGTRSDALERLHRPMIARHLPFRLIPVITNDSVVIKNGDVIGGIAFVTVLGILAFSI